MIGNHLKILEAQSTDVSLLNRGGGGIVTRLLAYMVECGKIKEALVITSSSKPPWAKPHIATNVDEIYASAGSKYQYVPYGDLINHLDEKSAIVGLPCQLRALKKRLVGLKIGLFCGINLSWAGMCYLLKNLKVNINEIVSLDYRAPGGGLDMVLQDGNRISYPWYSWLAYFFSYKMCLKCTDHTNHYSDISVGDRCKDWSTVIIRSDLGMKYFHDAIADGWIAAREISKTEMLKMASTPLIQKEMMGGYVKDPFIRVWGHWVEYMPMWMLRCVGQLIYSRHKRMKDKLIN